MINNKHHENTLQTNNNYTFNFSLIHPFVAAPPPPPPGHCSSGNIPGGGAPIGGGLLILVALEAAYGGRKVYDFRKTIG